MSRAFCLVYFLPPLIISAIHCIFSFLGIVLFREDWVVPTSTKSLRPKLNGSMEIFLTSIVNTPDWVRTELLYETWGKDFVKRFPDSQFRFLTTNANDKFGNLQIISTTPEFGYRSMYYLFTDAVKFYLEQTSLPWILRTTEDCFVNVALLEKFINELNSKYDPFRDIVIKGEVVRIGEGRMYLHGGSGWIFSRRAAELWLKSIDTIDDLYTTHPSWGDDVFLDHFRELVNLTNEEIDTPEFIGQPLNLGDLKKLDEFLTNSSFEFSQCIPSSILNGTLIRPIKSAVFWHSGRTDNFQMHYGKKIQEKVPPNLIIGWNQLCLLEENKEHV